MSIVDQSGMLQVPYSASDCFSAAMAAAKKLDGIKIDKIDDIGRVLYLKAGVSLFSWGEIVTVSIFERSALLSEIVVSSSPKVGTAAIRTMDMGKNKKNIIRIQQAITKELQSYNKLDPMASKGPDSIADEIKKLASLKEQGILTDEEFAAKKAQLLNL